MPWEGLRKARWPPDLEEDSSEGPVWDRLAAAGQ